MLGEDVYEKAIGLTLTGVAPYSDHLQSTASSILTELRLTFSGNRDGKPVTVELELAACKGVEAFDVNVLREQGA
jgi:hypothetical protein